MTSAVYDGSIRHRRHSPVELARFPAFDATAWNRVVDGRGIKEIELARIQDDHYYVVRRAADDLNSPARRERSI